MGAPLTARADWQYTHWGMSPDEVITSSAGRAWSVPAPPTYDAEALIKKGIAPSLAHRIKLAETTTVADQITFRTAFIFDDSTRRLVAVYLEHKNCNQADADRIRIMLTLRYGQPFENRSSPSYAVAETIKWLTRTDFVELTRSQFLEPASISCFLSFEEPPHGL
jgi:hypothetical protein